MRRLHLDGPLLGGILLICALGLVVLYSAVGENMRLWLNQLVRLGVAVVAMFIVAQLPPDFLRRWTPWGYLAGLVLLVLVLTTGEVGQERVLGVGHRRRVARRRRHRDRREARRPPRIRRRPSCR